MLLFYYTCGTNIWQYIWKIEKSIEWFIKKNAYVSSEIQTLSTRVHVKQNPLSFNVFTFLCIFRIVFFFKALALALRCRTDRYLSDTSEWLARCIHTTIPIYKYSFRFVFALSFRVENRSFLRVYCFSECVRFYVCILCVVFVWGKWRKLRKTVRRTPFVRCFQRTDARRI